MTRLWRRRTFLGALCAGLALLPAIGGLAGDVPASSRAAASTPAPTTSDSAAGVGPEAAGVAPGGAGPGGAGPGGAGPGGAGPGGAVAPAAGTPASPLAIQPVGWKLSDIPSFPPPPVPEPVTLPTGSQAPFLHRIPTTQPVAFITIDDGYLKPAEAPELLAAAHVPVTLFLTTDAIHDDVPFFDRLRAEGPDIEAHTISHPNLPGRSAASQHREICGSADRLGEWYGRRPVLFRPPYGAKDHTTLRVAHECGLRAGIHWTETVHKGKVRYQQGDWIQPGDIILMHFRPAFVDDFIAALRAIHRSGLIPARLTDYVPEMNK